MAADSNRVKPCRGACEGCAFTEGAVASLEPVSSIKAELSLLGGLPFYCHHLRDGTEVDLDDYKPFTPALMRGLGVQVCEGWRREVQALAATGYYKQNPAIKRLYAIGGLQALTTFLESPEDSPEKEEAATRLGDLILALNKARGFE